MARGRLSGEDSVVDHARYMQQALAQAEAALDAARAQLGQAQAGATQEEIAAARAF